MVKPERKELTPNGKVPRTSDQIQHFFDEILLVAFMPRKLCELLLRAGDEVRLGQGVVVVEAMKMQNEIKSPKAGRILEIRVAEGENVNNNQVLAVVE